MPESLRTAIGDRQASDFRAEVAPASTVEVEAEDVVAGCAVVVHAVIEPAALAAPLML